MHHTEIGRELKNLSSPLGLSGSPLSIVLAAGHGKRIKSEKSKMLHEIWGRPSVWRVCEVARRGLESDNQIVVVGIKALEVARALGRQEGRVFVYQHEQRGTGHAVQTALEQEGLERFSGEVYVFPGDMGLITEHTVRSLRDRFRDSGCDMVVLTGHYEGDPDENSYGRILKSRNHDGRIIEIKEHRDILAMDPGVPYRVRFQGREESFTRRELLYIREFNVGVYALRINTLRSHLGGIQPDNVQAELYVTDLIKILNDHGLRVCSSPVRDSSVVSFNVKSTLKKMEASFRNRVYERLKDIVTIDDPEDFFVAEETVQRIEAMDREHDAVEISVGKGASIGPQVEVNRGLAVGRNAVLEGHVRLGTGVSIGESAHLSTFPGQTIEIGDDCAVLRGNVIKGMVRIGRGVRIETGVRITGSSEEPVSVGNGVLIKGTTYLFGSVVEDDVLIEHAILKSCTVERVVRKDGTVQPVKYILPHPEGLDSIVPRRP